MELVVFTLSSIKRRIVYVCTFEFFAIIFSTLFLSLLSGSNANDSFPLAVMVTTAAVIWNFLYNWVFEAWERKRNMTSRSLLLRCAHAIGFEGGLILTCLPIYMLWYSIGPWKAFTMALALLVFFLVYTFIFTLLFDKVFTLPQHQTA
ncbi:hypothetical protein UZ73_00695 [Alcaligenes faecalis]|uniref:PACE efflux transporter n=1 Tax=Alcaligenes faecalis TaxID=511 RepID=UPI000697A869|nr:PACE efflux transporter [Alcaligenes faecalis]ALO40207.1 hypothetical protein UZ73_00695 [Alcaligenes faecalis]